VNRTFWYLVVAWLLCACSPLPSISPIVTPTAQIVASAANVLSPQTIVLPAPRIKGTLTLEETLARRRSVRDYTNVPLTLDEIGQLLWAAQGVTSSAGQRTAPSAGGLYPLEIYVATRDGVYHYEPAAHSMTAKIAGDKRQVLYDASLQQSAVRDAPAVLVIAAVYARTSGKYGDRTERYVQLEAGHAAQNILLQAVALNLGGVTIGAFEDDKVQKAIALPQDYKPLYVIPVGHPKQ
jgi:SagB-type dehydrogenase family enzyme